MFGSSRSITVAAKLARLVVEPPQSKEQGPRTRAAQENPSTQGSRTPIRRRGWRRRSACRSRRLWAPRRHRPGAALGHRPRLACIAAHRPRVPPRSARAIARGTPRGTTGSPAVREAARRTG
eukprot:389167-Prymnesium_polylepis.1